MLNNLGTRISSLNLIDLQVVSVLVRLMPVVKDSRRRKVSTEVYLLGDVIANSGSGSKHVPYRNSVDMVA